jgi:hypothetical protein
VKYLGHWLTYQGVLPDRSKMRAIQDMPYPESVTEVKRFLRMVTYLGKSIPNLSQITDSLRQLTKKESLWPTRNYRMHLMTQRKVSRQHCNSWLIFQSAPSVPTAVSSDASPHGLGAMLWQQDSRGHWTPVVCAGCSVDSE